MAGLVLWLLGYPTSAVEQSHAAVNLARGLSHPYSLAHAFCWAGMLHYLRRDVELTREFADSTVALSTEHGFRQWLAVGKILDGWGLAEQGLGEAAIAQIRAGIAEYRALGTELLVPYLFSLLAAAHVRNGDTEEGLRAALQGLEVAAVTGEQVWSAELRRLQGESMLAGTPSDESQAEAAYRQAVEIARCQAAGLWELRALTSLARLLKRQGARDAARRMLADAHGRITEGFDTPDLQFLLFRAFPSAMIRALMAPIAARFTEDEAICENEFARCDCANFGMEADDGQRTCEVAQIELACSSEGACTTFVIPE